MAIPTREASCLPNNGHYNSILTVIEVGTSGGSKEGEGGHMHSHNELPGLTVIITTLPIVYLNCIHNVLSTHASTLTNLT